MKKRGRSWFVGEGLSALKAECRLYWRCLNVAAHYAVEVRCEAAVEAGAVVDSDPVCPPWDDAEC